MEAASKHIIIDARIRRASTGRPVDRLLTFLPKLDTVNHYTVLVEKSDPIEIDAPNFRIMRVDYRQFSLNPWQQIGYSAKLYNLKPSLVFFTMTGQAPLFYFGKNVTLTHDLTMLRFVRAKNIPQIVHKIKMLGYKLLFWKGNKFAEIIFTPSEFVKKDLLRYMPSTKNKISVTYEAGSEPLNVKPKRPKSSSISKPFIFHVGSPFPHKNIENLVKAFESLKNKHPKLKLVLSGKKEYYFEELENWVKDRKYAEDIIITGYISDNELKWLYQNASAYVLPSLSEGFGLPGLEAMANNCPLVSSNATCLPEIYEDAAHYFNPEDYQDMSEKIDQVISDKKISSKLVKAGKKQVDKYSWHKMTKEIYEAYQKLI